MPAHAVVEQEAVMEVLQRMSGGGDRLRTALDTGFVHMERNHPGLARYLSDELATLNDSATQTLSYFLALVIYMSFDQAFGSRLLPVSTEDIEEMLDRLITDGELRDATMRDVSYSEDLVALGQPSLIRLIRSEIDRAIDMAPDARSFKEAEPLYEALLVQILVLSHAVQWSN